VRIAHDELEQRCIAVELADRDFAKCHFPERR
jgi:hypothetical protein